MAVKTNWKSMKGVISRPGVIRKVFTGKNSMLTLNEIEAKAEPKLHSHPHEQITQIVRGQCEFVLGDEVLLLKAGDMVLVPPNIPHSLKVIGEEAVLNVDIFSPIREDYLADNLI
jgi:quercetin dioxygenase-like cupin family protein